MKRNPHASISSAQADRVWTLGRESRPDLSRDEVLDVLTSEWGVRRQQRLLNTQHPDQLADRVLVMTKGIWG